MKNAYCSKSELEQMRQTISAHRQMWTFAKKSIVRFAEDTEESIRKEWDKFSAHFDKQTASMSDDQTAEYADFVYDEMRILRDEHPRMLRYAHCFMAVAAFEMAVFRLHKYCHWKWNSTKSDDKPSTELPMSKIHASFKNGGFQPECFGQAWQFMKAAREVRHAITHHDGMILSDDISEKKSWANKLSKKVRQFAESESLLTLEEYGRNKKIILELCFIAEMLKQADKAMNALFDEAEICLAEKIGSRRRAG